MPAEHPVKGGYGNQNILNLFMIQEVTDGPPTCETLGFTRTFRLKWFFIFKLYVLYFQGEQEILITN